MTSKDTVPSSNDPKSEKQGPPSKSIVLIGGGHAHVHAIKTYGEQLRRNNVAVALTLITNTLQTPYSGMLPGFVSGHYTSADIHIDLTALCKYGGFKLIHASAIGITYNEQDGSGTSRGGGTVLLDQGEPIPFDVLSIDVGSSPGGLPTRKNEEDDDGASSSDAIPVKPISTFATRYDQLKLRLIESATIYTASNPFTLLIVGGGAGGIELALSCQHALKKIIKDAGGDQEAVKIILATRGESMLESHNKKVRRIFTRILNERDIDVRYKANAVGIEDIENSGRKYANRNMKLLKLSSDTEQLDQSPILFDECLWCTSAGAASWITDNTPLETTQDGFIKVGDAFECINHPGVFAAGDCCHFVEHPRPKAGVFAVRAGPPLAGNIMASAVGRPLSPYKPQSDFLSLISTGDKYAVASRGRFAFEGAYLWKLKNRIDTQWMRVYKKL